MKSSQRHQNYELLNLLGYGLAKFDNEFIHQFGFSTKTAFYNYFVELGIVETGSVVKNRMDLFDPFFGNERKGWWQKGDTYIHRKLLIDSLFGGEHAIGFANIVKLLLKDEYRVGNIEVQAKPLVKTKYKNLQKTGLEAEMYFFHNFQSISIFAGGTIEDARLYGDGYDFQVNVKSSSFLAEVKGIREKKGSFRLTENEYQKAREYKDSYIVTLVTNLNDAPQFITIENPIKNLNFKEVITINSPTIEYHCEGFWK